MFDTCTIIEMKDNPHNLVVNWNHTGINHVPVSIWTMAAEGSQQIEFAGLGDTHQLTVVFSATLTGDFLPPQVHVIYAGKTQRCLPSTKFPNDWYVIFTQNHRANEETTEPKLLWSYRNYQRWSTTKGFSRNAPEAKGYPTCSSFASFHYHGNM